MGESYSERLEFERLSSTRHDTYVAHASVMHVRMQVRPSVTILARDLPGIVVSSSKKIDFERAKYVEAGVNPARPRHCKRLLRRAYDCESLDPIDFIHTHWRFGAGKGESIRLEPGDRPVRSRN